MHVQQPAIAQSTAYAQQSTPTPFPHPPIVQPVYGQPTWAIVQVPNNELIARQMSFDTYLHSPRSPMARVSQTPTLGLYHPFYVWDDHTAHVYETTMVCATEDQLDHERNVHDDYKAKAKDKAKRTKSSSDKGGTATQDGGKGGKGGKKSRGGGRGGKPGRHGKGTFHPTSYQTPPSNLAPYIYAPMDYLELNPQPYQQPYWMPQPMQLNPNPQLTHNTRLTMAALHPSHRIPPTSTSNLLSHGCGK